MNRFRKSRIAGYIDLDRCERRIQQHMLIALIAGAILGAIIATFDQMVPRAVYVVLDPYAFFLLVMLMGRIGLGFGWALVNSVLATFGTLLAELVGSVIVHGESPLTLGQSGTGLNTLLCLLVIAGVLAYGTRRHDYWGDLAAGALGAVMVANMSDDLAHWRRTASFDGWEWSLGAASIVAVACVVCLRPNTGGRLRAILLGMAIAVPFVLFAI
ncbi:hypothetical protein J5X84_10920 [Streptosporangiaceae bacterium NEAU-GS5]|nr:hypothetical protein [Streptosporangiaceae bacterium NEAU-GS5]